MCEYDDDIHHLFIRFSCSCHIQVCTLMYNNTLMQWLFNLDKWLSKSSNPNWYLFNERKHFHFVCICVCMCYLWM